MRESTQLTAKDGTTAGDLIPGSTKYRCFCPRCHTPMQFDAPSPAVAKYKAMRGLVSECSKCMYGQKGLRILACELRSFIATDD